MSTPQDQREPLTDTSDAAARQREALASPGESLSAMMDGECDDLEVRRAAARLLDDPDMQATWRRYHLVGAVLRGEVTTAGDESPAQRLRADEDAAARLRAAIAREPVRSSTAESTGTPDTAREASPAQAPASTMAPAATGAVPLRAAGGRRRWYTAGIGFATAAGLAGGLWLGTLVTPPGAGTPGPAALATVGAAADAAMATVPVPLAEGSTPGMDGSVPGVQPATAAFDAQRRTRMYMLMHAQQAGFSADAQGTALIKFVSHELQ